MKRNGGLYWQRRICTVLCVLLAIGMLLPALVSAQEKKVIRVAFPIQKGLAEIDENGNYSGYTYEYLQEIAQYTGWEYEIILFTGDLNTARTEILDDLKAGKVDLAGGMGRSRSLDQVYEYPDSSYGISYSTLSVLAANTSFNSSNFRDFSKLRIAVNRNEKARNQRLLEFFEVNDITPELIYCADEAEQIQALKEDLADAATGSDLNFIEGTRIIAKFDPKPFYFASTKGNRELVDELNDAVQVINEADPYFAEGLYDKYFGDRSNELFFTEEEQAYLERTDTVRVGVDSKRAPLQYIDSNTGELCGISKEILDRIHDKTGLKFELVLTDSQDELKELLDSGKVDMALGILYDYDTADQYNVVLTEPYASVQVTMAINNQVDPNDLKGKKLAMVKGTTYNGYYMGDVVWYDTISDAVYAVNHGKADYCYGNGYSIQYYVNQFGPENISLVPLSNWIQKLCVGVRKPVDTNLVSIVNKVIRSIPENELQSILYRNTMQTAKPVTLAAFIDANPREAIWFVALFFVGLLGLMGAFLYSRIRINRRIKEANSRYEELCDLSNEYIFEFDFRMDRLALSQKSAEYFGIPQFRSGCMASLKKTEEASDTEQRSMELERLFFQFISERRDGSRDLAFRMTDGSERWFRIVVKVLLGEDGKPYYTIGKMMDIQTDRDKTESLRERAERDGMTGVYNAAHCKKRIAECLRSDSQLGAFFILDVDRFKSVNDRYGHYKGDQILSGIAMLLQRLFRQNDIIGRLGGDEFLVYMRNVSDREKIVQKCRTLREAVRTGEQLRLPDGGQVTVSVGIAVASEIPTQDFDELYQAADQALYKVKRGGRNGFEIA